jgi:hydroxymethylbilane synthase
MAAALLRIGTRGSPLALIQAEAIRSALAAAHPALAEPGALEIVTIRTTGDVVRDRTLAAIGGKGLFTREIEAALLAGEIDLAVHSLKDMATQLSHGLAIACHLPRADPRDAFVSARAKRLLDLPQGAVVGSSALRRQAQLLRARPDLRIVPLRGNVDTRLGKVSDGKVDATLLAVAGLVRLGVESRITEILSTDLMLPAPAQGTIAVETRAGDDRVLRYLNPLDDGPTAARSTAERALLAALDGSCRTPIAALAEIDTGGRLDLHARIIRPDGTQCHEARLGGAVADAARIGQEIGARLRAEAGPGFFDLPIPEGTPV